MKIKLWIHSMSIAALLLIGFSQIASAGSLEAAPAAVSTDWKSYAGANCMQANQVNSDFRRTYFGYINDSADAVMVICPVVRDVEAAGKPRIEKVHVTVGSYGKGYCRVYSLTHDGSLFAVQFKNFDGSGPQDIEFTNIDASDYGSYTISCRIPGMAGIRSSYIKRYAVLEID